MATLFKDECCVLKMVYSKCIQMKETWKLVLVDLKVFTCHFPMQCVVLPFYFPSFSTAVSAKFNSKGEERVLDSKGV